MSRQERAWTLLLNLVLIADIGVLFSSLLFLYVSTLPAFADLFLRSRPELPVLTKTALRLSSFVQLNWLMVALLLVVAVVLSVALLRTYLRWAILGALALILAVTLLFGIMSLLILAPGLR